MIRPKFCSMNYIFVKTHTFWKAYEALSDVYINITFDQYA
jgi:hypothetical protein